MKPSLSCADQVVLLRSRGLVVAAEESCVRFLSAANYYRFSGYARYFQEAPHDGRDDFLEGTTFEEIRAVYDADAELRSRLVSPLAQAELLLRSHVARVIANEHGAYMRYLQEDFYADVSGRESTVDSCLRDIRRSRERHILRYRGDDADFTELPVWSAVEAWSFGTLSKVLERGGHGALADQVATSLSLAKAGFAYRVRALVYLRNRCAHHGRLWHHSVVDAGPTPNNVRSRSKRLAGHFDPRSVIDVVSSLDDVILRGSLGHPLLPALVEQHDRESSFWQGLTMPRVSRDHSSESNSW